MKIEYKYLWRCGIHGMWKKNIYPYGCPVCIAEKINNSPEAIEAKERRKR